MNTGVILTFCAVAGVATFSPGPGTLLAVRNGLSFGLRSVIWSAFGNICGLFCLSTAAMLGLGVLLQSSPVLFGVAKLIGAAYLFYVGLKHVFGTAVIFSGVGAAQRGQARPSRRRLWREAFLTATTNPKAILFFTALFPQFISAGAPLPPQFLLLTGIFMAFAYLSHLVYALIASRAGLLLLQSRQVIWVNRGIGLAFMALGAALLTVQQA